KLHKGIDAVANRGIGAWRTRKLADLDALLAESEAVLAAADRWRGVRDGELVRELAKRKAAVRRAGPSGTAADVRREALAVLCEAAFRAVRLRPYAVQIAGVLALERGCLAE